jgi:hypothetical protein
MEKKKVIGWSVSGVVLMLIIWVGVAAASIGGEASKLDTMLTKAMKDHRPIADVQREVTEMGFQLSPDGTGLKGKGPDHLAVIYRTWLTLEVSGREDGTTSGYHIDRASSIF